MNVRLLYLFILLTFIMACSNNEQTKNEEQILNDTIINLSINGQHKQFTAKKGITVDFKDFQLFLKDYANKPLLFIDTTLTDVTGDGNDEKVIRKIIVKDNNAYVFAEIFKDNKSIYADTLEIDDDYTFMTWDNDSIYFKLKPYSSFYEAYFNKEILDSLNKDYPSYEYWIEFYIGNKKNEFLSQGIDSLSVINKIDTIQKDLKKFSGKLVFTMHQLDREILIWNKDKNDFEPFYSP